MNKNFLKKILFSIALLIATVVVIIMVLNYSIEGEKELPFYLKKLLVVSGVDGNINDDKDNLWNVNVNQINDIYVYFDKQENYKNSSDLGIKEIKFENFIVNSNPSVGSLYLKKPTGDLDSLYKYSTENYLESNITYQGALIDDLKAGEICNSGGMCAFRFEIDDLGTYISNEQEEIRYDASLLNKLNINIEQLKFSVSFDIVIVTTNNIFYRGNINLNLPLDNFINDGSSSYEITDFSSIVFKRD